MEGRNQISDRVEAFKFRSAPIFESDLCSEFLSEQTRRSISTSVWAKACSNPVGGSPDVYVCEAFGGASERELSSLIAALGGAGKFVILVWTGDWTFPPIADSGSLVLDVSAPAPQSCSYGWKAEKYGPACLERWKPFAERRILASFVGSRATHSVRDFLFDDAIVNRPDVVVEDVDWWSTIGLSEGNDRRTRLEAHFEETLFDSKFAFCPRGNGPSSKRRWEAAYCGAIPILIDDFTKPFGIEMPLLEFVTRSGKSVWENAMDLLEVTVGAIPRGQQIQDQLLGCLTSDFDVPLLSPNHTTVGQIVRVANRAWSPGLGFVCGGADCVP
jgi:hypothetical protein